VAFDHQTVGQVSDLPGQYGEQAFTGGRRRGTAADEEHSLLGFQKVDA